MSGRSPTAVFRYATSTSRATFTHLMAIWQFDVSFVPRGGTLPWQTEDGHDGPPLPEMVAVSAHAWLLNHFGKPWLMMEGWLVFGHENGNRFDFLFNEDGSANLSARVDARSDFESFAAALSELASTTNCLLFSAEFWAAIEPSREELVAAITRSRASMYVKNPRSVLGGGNSNL